MRSTHYNRHYSCFQVETFILEYVEILKYGTLYRYGCLFILFMQSTNIQRS